MCQPLKCNDMVFIISNCIRSFLVPFGQGSRGANVSIVLSFLTFLTLWCLRHEWISKSLFLWPIARGSLVDKHALELFVHNYKYQARIIFWTLNDVFWCHNLCKCNLQSFNADSQQYDSTKVVFISHWKISSSPINSKQMENRFLQM